MAWMRTPIVLFLAAALAIGVVAAAAMTMHGAVRKSDAVATEEALDLGEVERLRGLRERISRKVRTFLLTGDQRFVDELRASERAFSDLLSTLLAAATTPDDRDLIHRIEERESDRRWVTERLIAARRSGTSTETLAQTLEAELQPIVDSLDTTIAKLVEFHRRQVEQARTESQKTFSEAERGLWAAAAVALLIAVLTSLALARTLHRIEGRAGRLQRERDRFFDLSIDMVCIAGTDGYFKQLNPAFEAVLGYTRDELLEKPFLEFVHVDDRAATLKVVAQLSSGHPTIDFDNRYACKDGTYKWLSWHASPQPGGVIYAVARDVTDRKANQEKLAALTEELRVLAVLDELTGLHNRRAFNILAEQHLKRAQRSKQKTVFLFADLDGLKQINDKLGHDIGDRAIRDAATVLASAFRKSDIVARLGGDEFVILATDATSDQQALGARVQEAVRQFNSTEPRPPFLLAMSIGSTSHDPQHPESIDAIIKRADEMMYEQKARRKAAAPSWEQ
jgi:diguanylate cyclase (GGDEF)-like protein/PAS domain S-box-containing protein